MVVSKLEFQSQLNNNKKKGNEMKVYCLGPKGTYGHEVATRVFPDLGEEDIVFHTTNLKILESVESEKGADVFAIVPVENSTSGAGLVSDVVPRFWLPRISKKSSLKVIKEFVHDIHHSLVKPKNGEVRISRIFSHPQALSQCNVNIRKLEKEMGHSIKLAPTTSTAGSIEKIQETTDAAICSEFAARNYPEKDFALEIISKSFNDNSFNQTTFHVLGFPNEKVSATHSAVLFELQDRPHGLVDALRCISGHGANMHMIHSIPIGKGRYAFYIEFDESANSEKGQKIYSALEKEVENLLHLGSFNIIK